jgi:hypothetical protein
MPSTTVMGKRRAASERRIEISHAAYQWLLHSDPTTAKVFRLRSTTILGIAGLLAGLAVLGPASGRGWLYDVVLAAAYLGSFAVLIAVGAFLYFSARATPKGLRAAAHAAGTDLAGLAQAIADSERRRGTSLLPDGQRLRVAKGRRGSVLLVLSGDAE